MLAPLAGRIFYDAAQQNANPLGSTTDMSLRRIWFLSAVIALVVSAMLWMAASNPIPDAIRGWVEGPVIPGYVIAAGISGREHGVSPILVVAANTVFWSIVATGVVVLQRFSQRGRTA